MQVMGKYAGKLEKEDRFSTYTDLVAARVMIDLTDRFDFGAEYRMLTSHRIDTRLHGGAAAARSQASRFPAHLRAAA